ncbi:MAG: DUF1697 domain-containing protein [Ktedonobacteraceae bacterium]|nr:DUF1697 domain-containing protein [Ktedonobacteraceae bacterium]
MLCIALLRGINVGGHVVKMGRLRELFTELGFTQVRTYIQSGNVFFETAQTDRETVTQTIEQHLHKALGYEVAVFLRTIPELEQIMALDPFQHLNVTPDMRLCVVFTDKLIPHTLALPLRSPKNDMEVVYTTNHEAFTVWYLINGRPPAAQGFKVLGDRTTTRFFHTVAKILQAAEKGETLK